MKKTYKRKNTRFPSPAGTLAKIEFQQGKADKKIVYIAQVITESFNGCSCVVIRAHDLIVGDLCRVKVGALPMLTAEIRWVIPLDDEIQKVGFMFKE
jgi:hypothetical protein